MASTVITDYPAGDRNPRVLQLKNARKIYSITVSHISWEVQDLANSGGREH